ncbi:hypothetical protein FRC07_012242 [Ceratobasidium sp. 392]|nr:hypothetical protein FRC07_012242 [Ceratobasidium sp. 392]
MSKRKAVGAYALSDDEDPPTAAPPPKKPHTQMRLSAPTFRMPQTASSRAQPVASVSPVVASANTSRSRDAASSLRTALPTPQNTPTMPTRTLSPSPSEERAPDVPLDNERSKGKQRAPPEAGPSTRPSQPSRQVVEREMHEMNRMLADCRTKIDEQEKEIRFLRGVANETKEALEALAHRFDQYKDAQATRWAEAAAAVAAAPAPIPAAPAAPVAPNTTSDPAARRYLTLEEAIMLDLTFDPRVDITSTAPVSDIKTLSNLVAAYRLLPKGPAFPCESQIRTDIRKAFFESLDNVSHGKEIKPPFYLDDGTHDLFPSELADPETGYVAAYLDWDKKMGEQIMFLERVLQRFRRKAGTNKNEYSILGRTIREDIIIDILLDGPWRTCKQSWSDMKKKPTELEARKQQSRRYKRKMAKVVIRIEHRGKLPGLAGKAYDPFFHEAMMSDEESEGEGKNKVLKVKRPISRSSHLNAVWDGVAEANRQERAANGNSFHPLKRIVEVVEDTGIPEPRRNGTLLPVPLCAFSGTWRANNRALIDKGDYRLNTDLRKFPDVSDFLLQYQPANDDAEEAPAQQLVPEKPRADVTDEGDGDMEDGVEEPARENADVAGEGWAQKEDEEIGEDEERQGVDAEGVLDTNLDKDEQATLKAKVAVLKKSIPAGRIDPTLCSATPGGAVADVDNAAAAPPVAPRPRPRPRPVPHPPTSSIRINLPEMELDIAPLPLPHPNHGAPPRAVTDSPHTTPAPTPVQTAEHDALIRMPPDGPQHPPPMLPPPMPEAANGTELTNGDGNTGTEGGAAGSGDQGARGGRGGRGGRGTKRGRGKGREAQREGRVTRQSKGRNPKA